ncbi:MAG TPA: ComEC/Rec2 family competence protein [Bacteroidia bacterium]|nr:ComEC/Rec2 family competence protein [Bacteroidia bacterium]
MNWFRQVPFLRLLIPLLSGILLALFIRQNQPELVWLSMAVTFLVILLFLIPAWKRFRRTFLFLADVCLFLYGMSLVQLNTVEYHKFYYGNLIDTGKPLNLVCRISDVPSEKTKSLKLQLDVLACGQNGKHFASSGKLIAYLKKQNSAFNLRAGDVLHFQVKLTGPEGQMNPGAFDYKSYLRNRGIYHLLFSDSSGYSRLPNAKSWNSISHLALQCKQWIVERLKSSGLNQESASVCMALLCGFDEEVDQDIIQAFAHSGTLHVLSVSGLHTGLIYAFLSFLFDLFDRSRQYKLTKFILITSILWAFALLIGLSAPVLRAVLMLSLFGIGSIFFRNDRRNQLNLLFVSAFILLVFQPYFISEVGFQLSFAALFGLIYFEPLIASLWSPQHTIVLWIWKSCTASFSATLSTLPFTLFYFHQFPVWFFLANLVVIPGSFVIMLLALPALMHLNWLNVFLNLLVKYLIKFISLFNAESLAYIDRIRFSMQDAVWISLLILLVSMSLENRRFVAVVMSLLVFTAWQLSSLRDRLKAESKDQICVYAGRRTSAFSLKQGRTFFYSISDSSDFQRLIRPHLIELGDPLAMAGTFNAMAVNGLQCLILKGSEIPQTTERQNVIMLVLSMNARLSEDLLASYPRLKIIITDASNTYRASRATAELCRKFGLLHYDTRNQGAFVYRKP